MLNHLREALGRLWTSFQRLRAAIAVKEQRDETERPRSSDARARFWTEFREGQREAESHSSRSR